MTHEAAVTGAPTAAAASTPLRLLILEDQPADAELMVRHLERAGFAPRWQRVETEPESSLRSLRVKLRDQMTGHPSNILFSA